MTAGSPEQGSRVEAAEAGIHAEINEATHGRQPEEHVTAADAATNPAPIRIHHHHPDDPNSGVVRGRLGPGAITVAAVSVIVTVVGVVLLALAVQGSGH